jgi:quercetin dioxygenase-like cupin family protein
MKPRTTPGRRVTRRAMLRTGMASAAAAALASNVLSAEPGKDASFTLLTYDKIKPEKFPWGTIRWLMSKQLDPDAEMTMGLVEIGPKQSNPLHIHPNCTEYLHVLSGSCEHRSGSRWIPLKAGDTMRIPKGVAHMVRTKDEACRTIVVFDTGTRQMVPVAEEKRS